MPLRRLAPGYVQISGGFEKSIKPDIRKRPGLEKDNIWG